MDVSHIDYEALKQQLKKRLTPKRYYHSLCVMEEAVRLADQLGVPREKAKLAGLLHDITKNTPDEEQLSLLDRYGVPMTDIERNTPKLYHAMSGALLLEKELGIRDREVLDAIRYHTTGRANMSLLEQTLYLADFVSADRDYEGVEELRKTAHTDFAAAMTVALSYTITELVDRGAQVHPDTISAWNDHIAKERNKQHGIS